MTTSAISAVTQNSIDKTNAANEATSKSANSENRLNESMDSFLKLLTTQLQHQDPLEPMDATEFTSQLVQFNAVEQSINTNRNLETLVSLQEDMSKLQEKTQQLQSIALTGKEVEFKTDKVSFTGQEVSINFDVKTKPKSMAVDILDERGETVAVHRVEDPKLGLNNFVWKGESNIDRLLPNGNYSFRVHGQNSDGTTREFDHYFKGTVSQVQLTDDNKVQLDVNGAKINFEDVLTAR